jgi:hypothetical protein
MNLLASSKPYKGGNDLLWIIHELNNIDKHRLLLLTGLAFSGADLGSVISRMAQPTNTKPNMSIFFPIDNLSGKYALKKGDPLFTDSPEAKIDKNIQFSFEVAFCEPGIIEGKSVVPTLKEMAGVVDCILNKFSALL